MKETLLKIGVIALMGLAFLLRIGGAIAGIVGSYLCLALIVDYFGVVAAIIAFLLLPATLALVPVYDAFAYGNWLPLILVYGGGVTVGITSMLTS